MKSKKEIYQIKITLNDTKPPIWRRFLVESNVKLPDLHKIIQTVMGWTNSHLHQFDKNGQYFCEPAEQEYYETIDYTDIQLKEFLFGAGDSCFYDYDFGDSWRHKIVLEKILHFDKEQKYPVCIKGKRNCPPEDCGGIWEYYDLLEIIKNPKHPDYESMMDWLGEDFDPEYLDFEEINELLQQENFGCFSMF